MEHSTSAPNGRVLRTTQLAKLSFNQPPVVLTADIFQYFYKKYDKQTAAVPQFSRSHKHTIYTAQSTYQVLEQLRISTCYTRYGTATVLEFRGKNI